MVIWAVLCILPVCLRICLCLCLRLSSLLLLYVLPLSRPLCFGPSTPVCSWRMAFQLHSLAKTSRTKFVRKQLASPTTWSSAGSAFFRKAAWLHARRPCSPHKLPDLGRFCVEAAVYMNDCLNTTATTANAGFESPYEPFYGRSAPANTLAFMQPGFRRVHRAHKSRAQGRAVFLPAPGGGGIRVPS